VLLFSLGHAAIATAAALTAVVAVRVVPVAPARRLAVACLTGGYALAIAVARLVETVHPLTDVLEGAATGLVVTLGGALALRAVSGSERSHRASAARGRDAAAAGS
jgi:membrane-associated phospholipid phosphatase